MDSFASLGFQKRDKMSLANQRKAAEAEQAKTREREAAQWESLFSGSGGSASQSQAPSGQPSRSTTPGSSLMDDLFGASQGQNKPAPQPASQPAARPAAQPAVQPSTGSILDDFDVFVAAPKASKPDAGAQKAEDDPFAIFNAPPSQNKLAQERTQRAPQPAPRQAARPAAPIPATDRRREPTPRSDSNGVDDRAIAQLVDMGFDPEDATRSLAAMEGDVRGAVSYLMAEAQGAPLPTPRKRGGAASVARNASAALNGDVDVAALATDFGASVLATASSFWSKGRKQIAKAVSEYQSGSTNGDGPAWMKDAHKYGGSESSAANVSSRASSASATSSRKFTSNDEMPSRPSRSQAFRDRQAQRSNAESPASATPEPSIAPRRPAAAAPTPELDLLNLSGSEPAKPNAASAQTGTQAQPLDIFAETSSVASGPVSAAAGAARAKGTEAFQRGDYSLAAEQFTIALKTTQTRVRALLLANRAMCRLKTGDAKGALEDADEGLRILPTKDVAEIEPGKPAKPIWGKLAHRRAEALEHTEKHVEAAKAYKVLLDNGFASPPILAARRRCQDASKPRKPEPTGPPVKKTQRRGWGTTGAEPTSASGKAALAKVRNEHAKQAQAEAERDALRDQVEQRINDWKFGKEENLRALLASLQYVLWADANWTPVGLHDLVLNKKVRIIYMKAVAKTHPDKVPSTASTETKMIAQGVFVIVNKAWDLFRAENNM